MVYISSSKHHLNNSNEVYLSCHPKENKNKIVTQNTLVPMPHKTFINVHNVTVVMSINQIKLGLLNY